MALNRVMHVDDNESIRLITEMALVDIAGFKLLSCDGGYSALSQAEAFAPELIILDAIMPEMDGLQTLFELRKLPSLTATPVVFMTANVQPSEKQKFLDAGAVAVVEKPFEPMELGDIVREIYTRAMQD
ncbi:response regulator [Bermanella sp. R86510]|uniref:response regulator n=1 Tax=unclassified Bermanella TaxID=2627862 RepID=UPI0037C84B1D